MHQFAERAYDVATIADIAEAAVALAAGAIEDLRTALPQIDPKGPRGKEEFDMAHQLLDAVVTAKSGRAAARRSVRRAASR